jgi:biopolymer transport protein ExbD
MLVLLIIFMVAAPLPTVAIKVEIPPPPPTPALNPKPPVFVTVQKGGRLFVADVPTSRARLIADLSSALQSAHPTAERVMLRADRDVPYRELMDVMNSLHVAGFDKIGLIAEDL